MMNIYEVFSDEEVYPRVQKECNFRSQSINKHYSTRRVVTGLPIFNSAYKLIKNKHYSTRQVQTVPPIFNSAYKLIVVVEA